MDAQTAPSQNTLISAFKIYSDFELNQMGNGIASTPLKHGPLRSLVIDQHQERTLKSIFGKKDPDIPKASAELVEFFENIQFPVVNMGISQPA